MTRLRGWAPKGVRLIDKVPQGRWKTATFLAALRQDRIDAPCLFEGPINRERFRAYVEQFLVPTLKPGDVVILDNLGSHKGKAVRKAIRDVGARLVFLPKYSPDLNPIEQVFAKFKTLLRKVGARTYEAISDASAEILAQYQPAECAAYLRNASGIPSFREPPDFSAFRSSRRANGEPKAPHLSWHDLSLDDSETRTRTSGLVIRDSPHQNANLQLHFGPRKNEGMAEPGHGFCTASLYSALIGCCH
jgi:transposase